MPALTFTWVHEVLRLQVLVCARPYTCGIAQGSTFEQVARGRLHFLHLLVACVGVGLVCLGVQFSRQHMLRHFQETNIASLTSSPVLQ